MEITAKQHFDFAQRKRRLYKLHYQLRRRGNKVNAREKFITKRAKEITAIEQKYIAELAANQYGVCDPMFSEFEIKEVIK